MGLSQISWRDVQKMPDDGRRREAIAGELHVTAREIDPGEVYRRD